MTLIQLHFEEHRPIEREREREKHICMTENVFSLLFTENVFAAAILLVRAGSKKGNGETSVAFFFSKTAAVFAFTFSWLVRRREKN